MSDVGIVRRMDELGRIVIPKELRRSLRLREGDEMEIFPEGELIVIRKHMRLNGFAEVVEGVVRALVASTGCGAFAVCADCVIAAAGRHSRELLSKRVSEKFAAAAGARKPVVFPAGQSVEIAEGEPLDCGCAVTAVVQAGDVIGAVALLGADAGRQSELLSFAASALSSLGEA